MNDKDQIPATALLARKLKMGKRSIGRRVFVKRVCLAGLLTQVPFKKAFQSVLETKTTSYKTDPNILNKDQRSIVQSVQQYLFPDDGSGPNAHQIQSKDYLMWVLSDPKKDPADTKYIIDGIGWVDETANEEVGKSFLELDEEEKETLIAFVAEEGWGSSWLSIILGFIFEALISDPQYGGNVDETGWKWLGHFPGYPRPTEPLLYGHILKTVDEQ